jgi:phage terminase small subunit
MQAKPIRLKLLEGNAGKKRLSGRNPEPAAGCAKPDYLTGKAGDVWDELAPHLTAIGVLKAIDAPMFTVLCCLIAKLEDDPMNFRMYTQLRQFASCFGMDPVSRSRIVLHDDPEAKPQSERFFKIAQ